MSSAWKPRPSSLSSASPSAASLSSVRAVAGEAHNDRALELGRSRPALAAALLREVERSTQRLLDGAYGGESAAAQRQLADDLVLRLSLEQQTLGLQEFSVAVAPAAQAGTMPCFCYELPRPAQWALPGFAGPAPVAWLAIFLVAERPAGTSAAGREATWSREPDELGHALTQLSAEVAREASSRTLSLTQASAEVAREAREAAAQEAAAASRHESRSESQLKLAAPAANAMESIPGTERRKRADMLYLTMGMTPPVAEASPLAADATLALCDVGGARSQPQSPWRPSTSGLSSAASAPNLAICLASQSSPPSALRKRTKSPSLWRGKSPVRFDSRVQTLEITPRREEPTQQVEALCDSPLNPTAGSETPKEQKDEDLAVARDRSKSPSLFRKGPDDAWMDSFRMRTSQGKFDGLTKGLNGPPGRPAFDNPLLKRPALFEDSLKGRSLWRTQ